MSSKGANRGEDERRSRRISRLSDHEVSLPEDVSVPQWALERRTVQNPRIRSLLGCIRSLESVLDSNYAILHCSPQRLHEVWRRVLGIAELIRTELAPLFSSASCIPQLEAERRNSLLALELLESTVLRNLEGFPAELESGQLNKVRKLLCVSMGKLHAFLQDALARTISADPRSRFDADYFLSRRFPHDVEEAEWLWASVEDLGRLLEQVHAERVALVAELAAATEHADMQMEPEVWRALAGFLERIHDRLVPRLREVLSLRGIRFDEMEVLDRYARELPMLATLVTEIGEHAQALHQDLSALPAESAAERARAAAARRLIQKATNQKLSGLLVSLDERLRDLEAFVPFWLQEIGRRRALMLRSSQRQAEGEPPSLTSFDDETTSDWK